MKPRHETEERIRSLGWWYQHFQFPNGVRTGSGQEPGYDVEARWNLLKAHVPKDLTGKTVLDLGGNAGFFAVQMKRRGAARCVLVDPFVQFIEQAKFTADQFEVEVETVIDDAHTFCLTTESRFDYIVCVGLIYHLKYPTIVLDRLAEMTKERILIQSALEEAPNAFAPNFRFVEHDHKGDDTCWWFPNYEGLAALVRSSGMEIITRPHPQLIVAKPVSTLGKVVLPKLVFPKYGKRGGSVFPGPQRYDPGLWSDLIERSRESE